MIVAKWSPASSVLLDGSLPSSELSEADTVLNELYLALLRAIALIQLYL